MTTQTQSQLSLGKRQSAVYDRLNSILALTIYYSHHWNDTSGKQTNSMTYYLKYQNDKHYVGLETELIRAFGIIKKNYSVGRRFQSVQLYQNWNKGGQLKGVDNSLVFQIQWKGSQLDFKVPEIVGDENGAVREYIGGQLQEVLDLHNSIIR